MVDDPYSRVVGYAFWMDKLWLHFKSERIDGLVLSTYATAKAIRKVMDFYNRNMGWVDNAEDIDDGVRKREIKEWEIPGEEELPRKYKKSFKTPRKILWALEDGNQRFFVVQWPGDDTAHLVPAHVAIARFPRLVIAFHESRLKWLENNKTG